MLLAPALQITGVLTFSIIKDSPVAVMHFWIEMGSEHLYAV